MKILVLEDNIDNAELIAKSLRKYEIVRATSVAEAQNLIAQQTFDLFIIDINLPDGNGFDFCSELSLQSKFEATPKIILSGLSETKDKVYGFQCGAEDYINKPFAVEELRVRVEARLKRAQLESATTIDQIKFDFQFQKAIFIDSLENEIDLDLTPTEFKILHLLLSNKNRLCSRQDLVREIWKKNGLYIARRGIDSHLSHLRKKLAPYPIAIQSVYGQGYVYSDGFN